MRAAHAVPQPRCSPPAVPQLAPAGPASVTAGSPAATPPLAHMHTAALGPPLLQSGLPFSLPLPLPPALPTAPCPTLPAVLSASLDGTVRAYDLVRYRNFRTLTTPAPVQFVSLAVDPAGEVCPGPGRLPLLSLFSCSTSFHAPLCFNRDILPHQGRVIQPDLRLSLSRRAALPSCPVPVACGVAAAAAARPARSARRSHWDPCPLGWQTLSGGGAHVRQGS